MAEQYGPFGLSYEDEKRRLENVALAKKFISVKGPDRNAQRIAFTTENGRMILPFAYGNDPRNDEINGSAKTFHDWGKAYLESGEDTSEFHYWTLGNETYFSTDDPDVVFVECDGQSIRYDKRFPDLGYYHNRYLLGMDFIDGKLNNVKEPFNPSAVFENLGYNREPKMF